MKTQIKTYSGPGIRKSRGNIRTGCWISIEPITADTAERRNNISPSFPNVLGHTPTYRHQGTPTRNENILKLQNVPASPSARCFAEETMSNFVSTEEPQLRAKWNNLSLFRSKPMLKKGHSENGKITSCFCSKKLKLRPITQAKWSTMLTPNATVGAVTVSCNNIITMMEMMTQICRRKSTVTEHKLHDHNLPHKILSASQCPYPVWVHFHT